MAITIDVTTGTSFEYKPTNWSAPATSVTFSGTPIQHSFSLAIAAAGNTDPSDCSQGLTDLLAVIKTALEDTYLPSTLKVCATNTVNGIATINKIEKKNSEACPYLTGAETFYITGTLQYE